MNIVVTFTPCLLDITKLNMVINKLTEKVNWSYSLRENVSKGKNRPFYLNIHTETKDSS